MKPDDFESLCGELYDLTVEQREGLLYLLQSRIWLYDADNSEFERIYEFDDASIKIILRGIEMELLAYALKGTTENLIKKFSKNMPKTNASKLVKKMKVLGPIRLSQRDQAQAKILETINLLAAAGEMELPPGLDCIPAAFEGTAPRLQATVLHTLSDSCLKSLIREVEEEDWVDFLWYINDARLTRKVFAFSSPHVANKLMHDFTNRWKNVDPESATEMQLEKGKLAMAQVLGTLQQMVDIGEIWLPNRNAENPSTEIPAFLLKK